MITVEQIRTLCLDDPEVKMMTDAEIETIEADCYRIARLLLEAMKGSDI